MNPYEYGFVIVRSVIRMPSVVRRRRGRRRRNPERNAATWSTDPALDAGQIASIPIGLTKPARIGQSSTAPFLCATWKRCYRLQTLGYMAPCDIFVRMQRNGDRSRSCKSSRSSRRRRSGRSRRSKRSRGSRSSRRGSGDVAESGKLFTAAASPATTHQCPELPQKGHF